MSYEIGNQDLLWALKSLGYERVTGINPPVHNSTTGYANRHTLLSEHDGYLLFHYVGGNRTIRTATDLARVHVFLSDSWDSHKGDSE